MYELNLWRARVGLFNLVKNKHHRARRHFSQSDIKVTTSHIKHFTSLFFIQTCLPTSQTTIYSLILLILQLHPTLFLLINPFLARTYTTPSVSKHIKYKTLCTHLFSLIFLLLLCGDVHPNPGPCINYSVCHINARSIMAPHRLDDIEVCLGGCHGYDIIAVSETHLDSTVIEAKASLPDYDFFRLDRNRNGGGVGIYCRSNMAAKRLHVFEIPGLELIWIEFICASRRNVVGCCYRRPGQNLLEVNSFLHDLENSIQAVLDSNPHSVTILGDFNDRCTLWDSLHSTSELGNKLYNLITNNNLFQLITEPTRGNNILDLIITNSPNHYFDYGVLQSLPDLDHCIIYAKFQQFYISSTNYLRTIWDYELGNYQAINTHLTNNLTIDPTLDVSANVINLTKLIHQSMQNYIPNKKILIRPRDKPWFTSTVRKLNKECHRAFKLKNKTNNPTHIDQFRLKRQHAKNALRQARRHYYTNLANQILDPETTTKKYWTLVKSIFNNNKHASIPTLIDNGVTYTKDSDKAEVLNNYSIKSGMG